MSVTTFRPHQGFRFIHQQSAPMKAQSSLSLLKSLHLSSFGKIHVYSLHLPAVIFSPYLEPDTVSLMTVSWRSSGRTILTTVRPINLLLDITTNTSGFLWTSPRLSDSDKPPPCVNMMMATGSHICTLTCILVCANNVKHDKNI